MRQPSLIRLLFAAAASNAVAVAFRAKNPSTTIKWTKCDPALERAKMSRLPIECANVTAPLDYTSQEYNETIVLELIRVSAAKQPSKGTILFNFGGPGDAGRSGMVGQMDQLMPYVVRSYRII
jgi:hypothetical protein